jgi:hypothetical protein
MPGTEYRLRTFGFIELNCSIIHPTLFKTICDLKQMYKEIMSSKTYAVWDKELKDFVKTDMSDGQTGYSFFFNHIHEVKFEKNDSTKRIFNLKLFEEYRDNFSMDRILVLPAGLRDYSIDDDGNPTEDEVNKLYRKVLSLSRLIDSNVFKLNESNFDITRYNIQQSVFDIYEYFKDMLEGKSKFIQAKWTARKIFNTTRNVISSLNDISDTNKVGFNETVIGLHQFLRSIVPLSVYLVKERYLSKVFPSNDSTTFLTNAKTFKKEQVTLDADLFDLWTSQEGIESTIVKFGNLDTRHEAIKITDKYYIGLLYRDKTHFKFIQDIDEVPTQLSKDNVSPITYAELLFISVGQKHCKIPALITRYPVINYGGIYPTYLNLRTTIPSSDLIEYDDSWNDGDLFYNFPNRGEVFFNTMALHPAHLKRLGADHDGDALSVQALLSNDAQEEIKQKLNTKAFYVSDENNFFFSASNPVVDIAFTSLTR